MKNTFPFLTILLTLSLLQACTVSKMSPPEKSNRLVMEKAFVWQEANPIFAKHPTDWTNGAYYVGVVESHKATNNPVYLKGLKKMAVSNEYKPNKRVFHADDIVIATSYLYLEQLGESDVDLAPTEKWIYDHLNINHDWKQGIGKPEQSILWWWCDALFMAPPVLVQYSNLTGDKKYLDEMHKYYMETYDLLFDKEEKLFLRDTRYAWTGGDSDKKEANGKKIFWSRGNGWVIAGLALMLDRMPEDYVHRPFYVDLYKTMAGKLKDIQPEDGLWRTSLLSPESFPYGEASGSGFHTYAIAWGINNGLLDEKTYKPVVEKAWVALKACQQENGKVGWVQNIGADPQPANEDSWQNFGTGAFILAGSEMIQLK